MLRQSRLHRNRFTAGPDLWPLRRIATAGLPYFLPTHPPPVCDNGTRGHVTSFRASCALGFRSPFAWNCCRARYRLVDRLLCHPDRRLRASPRHVSRPDLAARTNFQDHSVPTSLNLSNRRADPCSWRSPADLPPQAGSDDRIPAIAVERYACAPFRHCVADQSFTRSSAHQVPTVMI